MSKISSQIQFGDLTGGINNVDSKETLNSSPKKTETPEMVNVEYFMLGGVKSMEGNELNDPNASRQQYPVIAGWEYVKGKNRYMLIGLSNGDVKIYDETAVSETDPEKHGEYVLIYHFEHPTERMSFCNMNNGVVITNGVDDPVFYEKGRKQRLSGTISIVQNSQTVVGVDTQFTVELKHGDTIYVEKTVTDPDTQEQTTISNVYEVNEITDDTHLTIEEVPDTDYTSVNYYLSEISECNAILVNTDPRDPTADAIHEEIRGLAIQFYKGRLWIGGDNAIWYSQVGQYNKWDIDQHAGVIRSIYNDTSKVTALGLFSEYLMIHKELNTYILTMTGDETTITVSPFSNVTCESQQSWIVSNTKYYVYSREFMDIYPLVQHTIFNDKFLGEPVSQKVRNIFKTIRRADSDKIFCVSRPKERQMIFYLPTAQHQGSSYALIYDFQTKSWLARAVPDEVTVAFNYKNNIYIGTASGLVLKEFTGPSFKVYNEDTGDIEPRPINAIYKSPWFDWAGDYTHSFAEFVIEIDNDYNNDFYIRTWKDGGGRTEDRNIASSKLVGEALIWDGIEGQELEDNDTVWNEDIWVKGSFENIRMLLPNNVFEDFQIELTTPELNQAFAVYQYGFRRIETEEAPW